LDFFTQKKKLKRHPVEYRDE